MKKLEKELKEKGFVEISSGVYLQTSKSLIEDQKTWSTEDQSKKIDFTPYPYWITTDDGATPDGFFTIKEAIESVV